MTPVERALDRWKVHLSDVEPCNFPVLNDNWDEDSNDEEYSHTVELGPREQVEEFIRQSHISLTTLVQAAWALTTRSYTGSDSICFGFKHSRHPDTLPLALDLGSDKHCSNLLDKIESWTSRCLGETPCKLEDIEQALNIGKQSRLFNHSVKFVEGVNGRSQLLENLDFNIEVTVDLETVTASFGSRTSIISQQQAKNIISAFEQALEKIIENSQSSIKEISLFTKRHAAFVDSWTVDGPWTKDQRVHDAIFEHCRQQPDAPAVLSWDEGAWSYSDLETHVNALANVLLGVGAGHGTRISTLFSKSAWSIVAYVAILKIGATLVPLDAMQPVLRLSQITGDADVELIISSKEYAELLQEHVKRVVIADKEALANVSTHPPNVPSFSPDAYAWILSTSGSTGKPKGVMTKHRAFMSLLDDFKKTLGWNRQSRVMQHSSFSFIISLFEVFGTLVFGGCIAIPSLREKEDNFAKCFNDYNVNNNIITPSLLRQISPEDVPSLRTVGVGGEPLTPDIVRVWSNKLRFVALWGATECGIFASNMEIKKSFQHKQAGRCRAYCRVVEIGNHHRQVPIGAAGELVVQAPWLAEGYVNDPELSAKSFIRMPEWRGSEDPYQKSRWYKVGDLARQNSDGSLMSVGRSDSMVKLRGQKINLTEISFKLVADPKVDGCMVFIPTEGPCKQRLVGVVVLKKDYFPSDTEISSEMALLRGPALEVASQWVADTTTSLGQQLPSHMVPTAWIMLSKMPLTASKKMDRMALKRFVTEMSTDSFDEIMALGLKKEEPETPQEKAIQAIWSAVLKLSPDRIPRNQSFLSLGGDSLSAMTVRTQCKLMGIEVSVQDILRYSTIGEIAQHASEVKNQVDLKQDETWQKTLSDTRRSIIERGLLSSIDIEQAYPCTPVQKGMLLSRSRNTGKYDVGIVFEQAGTLSSAMIQQAWESVVARHPILRTVFLQSSSRDGFVDQVVLARFEPKVKVLQAKTESEALQVLENHPPPIHDASVPSHELTLVQIKADKSFIRVHIHHTLIDGYSIAIILRDLARAYDQKQLRTLNAAFGDYVGYLSTLSLQDSIDYWSETLAGVQPCLVPQLVNERQPVNSLECIAMEHEESQSILALCKAKEITLPSLLKTIWGCVLGVYTSSEEVCFGYLTSGRDAPLADIQDAVGPFINMLLSKMSIDERSIVDLARSEQEQYLNSLPHQHCSLAEIQHALGLGGQRLFNTNLSMLRSITADSDLSQTFQLREVQSQYPTEFDISIVVQVSDSSIRIELSHWTGSISNGHAKSILNTFMQGLSSVVRDPSISASRIGLLSSNDFAQITEWNSSKLDTIYRCIHDLISAQAAESKNTIAIESWDGNLTYHRLEELSNIVAHKLIAHGVGPERHVILCSEKRLLAIVSIVAVLKAGGSLVCIDPAHPKARLKRIMEETFPVCVLSSPLHRLVLEDQKVLVIDEMLVDESLNVSKVKSEVKPSNAALVLFTSGSTGVPKGIVHEHQSVSTSAVVHSKRLGVNSSARVLQFSAFTFDVSFTEICTTLISGGCLVVPSQEERMNDLGSVISRRSVNWAHLTPTVCSLLNPDQIPSLQNLVLAGELMEHSNLATWADRLALTNIYGPAEVMHGITAKVGLHTGNRVQDIGTGTAVKTWIVDPTNCERLMPMGAVGELVVEGPILAREYHKDAKKTADAFVSCPEWRKFEEKPPTKLYRTGDLARYNSDGSLFILGRRDTQIKLHGQRVEVEEIELHVKQGGKNVLGFHSSAVIFAKTAGYSNGVLAAVMGVYDGGSLTGDKSFATLSDAQAKQMTDLRDFITERLPQYMVPSLYIPMVSLPQLNSGKTDRRTLATMIEELTQKDMLHYSLAQNGPSVMPATWMQRILAGLWSKILNLPIDRIGANDHFFRLGGDSVVAMKLSALARAENLAISVESIFQQPRLTDMALKMSLFCEKTLQLLQQKYDIDRTRIQGVYPCTNIQTGLVLSSLAQSGAYVGTHVLKLSSVDINSLKRAWDKVQAKHDILRTTIIDVGGLVGHLQIVESSRSALEVEHSSLETYLAEHSATNFTYGSILNRACLVKENNEACYFVWTAHHAVYDSRSAQLLFTNLLDECQRAKDGVLGASPNILPFHEYVNYTLQRNMSKAEEYWGSILSEHVPTYPVTPTRAFQPLAKSRTSHSFKISATQCSATVIKGAWAFLLSKYAGFSSQVVFGITNDGRDEAIEGVGGLVGPTITVMPLVVSVSNGDTVDEFLEAIEQSYKTAYEHRNLGIQNIKALSPSASMACDFGSLLSVNKNRENALDLSLSIPASTSYPLTIECTISENSVEIAAQFDERIMPRSLVDRMIWQLSSITRQMTHGAMKLNDVESTSPEDNQDIIRWNGNLPRKSLRTIQELIKRQALLAPESEALCSHEGIVTYRELEEQSDKLASHLSTKFKVGRGTFVALAFSKSPWVVVAMLAILKSGGIFVPLDPSSPIKRLKRIIESTATRLILCSPDHEETVLPLRISVLSVDSESISMITTPLHTTSSATSDEVAYLIYTSGSTGMPKGVPVEHGSYSTAAIEQGRRLNIDSNTRAIHFASYAFDAYLLETLTVLIHGGCVCVPQEFERLGDITEPMRKFRVNWAAFTPSFVRTIDPAKVPELATLMLGGEKMGADNIEEWANRVYLINAYGPAEACVISTIHAPVRLHDPPDLIGTNCGVSVWIVDPNDASKLAPVGSVGELLIEGPTIGRGYFDSSEAAFVDNPRWLDNQLHIPSNGMLNGHTNGTLNGHKNGTLDKHTNGTLNGYTNGFPVQPSKGPITTETQGHANGVIKRNKHAIPNGNINGSVHSATHNSNDQVASSKVYKTGDLGRYDVSNLEGGIRIVGRKDTQVKIRGQRVELGDIEQHIRSILPAVKDVAAEQAMIHAREYQHLVAFICFQESPNEPLLRAITPDLHSELSDLKEKLGTMIPTYMIPNLYVVLSHMPRSSAGKSDRNRLRELASNLTQDQLHHFSLTDGTRTSLETDAERLLANAWATTLKIPMSSIGREDNFFKLGGDSIAAMRMTTSARSSKLKLTVAQVFATPRLDQMALISDTIDDDFEGEIESFSLLKQDARELMDQVEKQYGISSSEIEDILPVTPLQEGLMLLSLKTPGSYVARVVLTLQPNVNLKRFRWALQQVAYRNSILRTTIVYLGQQSFQVVRKEQFEWKEVTGNVEDFLKEKDQLKHGDPLTQYAIIKDPNASMSFVLTAHHSLYDGWSLKIIFEELDKLYSRAGYETTRKPPQFSSFLDHLLSTGDEATKKFWTSQFDGKDLATWPEPSKASQPEKETTVVHYVTMPRYTGSDVTMSNIIRAAWAMVMAKHANTKDVFFGAVLMGRNASLPNIERMTGPTITTVPLCISVDSDSTVESYLHAIRDQSAAMIPFEHTGLQNIKTMSQDAERACGFQNLLVVQSAASDTIESNLWNEKVLFARGEMVTLTYSLILECRLYQDEIRITAQYRQSELPSAHIERVLYQFEHVLQQFTRPDLAHEPLHNIDVCSPQDVQEMSQWNQPTLKQIHKLDQCIHRNVESIAALQPESPAVASWDAQLTYAELDGLANKLAHHLKTLGVGPEVYVALCFDKSAWAIVAMYAVLKAGGGYLCLDPKHPMDRKENIISQAKSKVILVGEQYEKMYDSNRYQVLAVGSHIQELHAHGSDPCPEVVSSNTAFLVFTSGSTGIPKGIVMEHGSFCSGAANHCKALNITSKSRVMQFASYTYDVSMGEIFSTLMQGGCICVPSEEERLSNLSGSINFWKANWMFLTPTVADFLKPEQVPTLTHLVLGGEHSTNSNIRTWSKRVFLTNSYGPAECAIWCACNAGLGEGDDPSNLGKPIGATLWILDSENPNKLAPIGSIGELAVEGPTLAREYLNDSQKTANAFIQDPAWAKSDGKSRRIYRTGDLVRYSPSGSLHILGRKDHQVKLRGQRIELGEIEYHLSRFMPEERYGVVELVRPEATKDPILTAFIANRAISTGQNTDGTATPASPELKAVIADVQGDLEKSLPMHMIPTTFLSIDQLPMSAGGKVDRKQLRKLGANLSPEEIQASTIDGSASHFRETTSEQEIILKSLWIQVLDYEDGAYGKDSNFLRSGGDSISAMKLSAAARNKGFSLSVRDIFLQPTLEEMAMLMVASADADQLAVAKPFQRFATLNTREPEDLIASVVCPKVGATLQEVEDVMPATDYQRWTFGCNQLQTRGYLNYFTYHIKGILDIEKLAAACHHVISKHPVLRTTFVMHRDQLLQVIVQAPTLQSMPFSFVGSEQQAISDGEKHPVLFGSQILRFYLVRGDSNEHTLMMRISHAQYDGISIPLISEDIKRAYYNNELTLGSPYTEFIQAVQRTPIAEAEDHYQQLLKGSQMTNVVAHCGPSFTARVDKSSKRSIKAPKQLLSQGTTFATIMKAAWSVVLKQLTLSDDVVFGQVSSGRNTAIDNIENIVGPCINLLPVRVNTADHPTFTSLMEFLQTQHLNMTSYETLGFQHIIERCTEWPKWTRFSSVLQHTSINIGLDEPETRDGLTWQMGAVTPDHDVSDVWIWTGPKGKDEFYIDFTYSSLTMSDHVAERILGMLCDVLDTIMTNPSATISSDDSHGEKLLPLQTMESTKLQTEHLSPGPKEQDPEIEFYVRDTWANVLQQKDLAPNVPYFEIRGDLIVAAQFASEYRERGYPGIHPEDIIRNPSVAAQCSLLRSKKA